ncbi:MAG: CDP-alcohol phosphatidyltransferase family protein [Actinomycetota bacterium]|nr:CDP-alcohol phosphatidyltransferase family protein [Actinomycetota bacterium]
MDATDAGRPRTALERLAQRTHGVVTPANALDVLAMVGVVWSAPRLDRWSGIAVGAPSYLADMADGMIARRTNTSSRVGELVDHVGDKPKVFLGLREIWRLGVADKPLLAAVGCYNLANAALTSWDFVVNEEPQIAVTRRAKHAMFATATGVGVQAIGHKIGETHPRVGRMVTSAGGTLGYGGVLLFGVPTTVDYWNMARRGTRRSTPEWMRRSLPGEDRLLRRVAGGIATRLCARRALDPRAGDPRTGPTQLSP